MFICLLRHSTKNLRAAVLSLAVLAGTIHAAAAVEVSFAGSEKSVEEIIDKIERQTDYKFAFDNTRFDISRKVVLPQTDLELEEVLKYMLAGSDFTYVIRKRYIVIAPNTKEIFRQAPLRNPGDRTGDIYVRTDPNADNTKPDHEDIEYKDTITFIPEDTLIKRQFPDPYSMHTPVDTYIHTKETTPRWAVKTNLLYAAGTFTPNISVEMGLGGRTTLAVSAAYNPWNRNGSMENNDKLVHRTLRAEYRHWLCERFNGHFFGGDVFHYKFNVGGKNVPMLFDKEYRYAGKAYGVGVSYGYALPIARHWNVEFGLGFGVAKMKYDKFACKMCTRDYVPHDKIWVGPTRAMVNMVFFIK